MSTRTRCCSYLSIFMCFQKPWPWKPANAPTSSVRAPETNSWLYHQTHPETQVAW